MNFLPVTAQGREGDRLVVSNPTPDPVAVPGALTAAAGGRLILGVRPQYLRISLDPAEGRLHGTVALTDRLGAETIVKPASGDGGQVIAASGEDAVLDPGREVSLTFDPGKAHPFAPEARAPRAAH